MSPQHTAPARVRSVRHARRLHRHPFARGLALVVTAALVFGVSGVAAAYVRLQGNVHAVDLGDLVVPPANAEAAPVDPTDPTAGRDLNILVMGSDSRSGQNSAIDSSVVDGMRSDTAMVVHISADRTRVEAVSIPRDSLVKIPKCTATNGKTARAQSNAMFNSAFATGWDLGQDLASAAVCTISTVQTMTGLTIDHFVVVDFTGFVGMVNALGGVPMCIPEAMDDSYTGLHLAAGQQVLDGDQALKYSRARHNIGNGSDTGRIERQQEFVAAMVRTAMSADVLTDPSKLLGFLDAATASLTMDGDLASLTSMAGLAFSLRDINTSNVVFLTIPWKAAPSDPNRVVWTSAATAVWTKLAQDQPLVPAAPAAATTGPSATTGPTATTGSTSTPTSGATAPPTVPASPPATDGTITADQVPTACG